MAWEIKYTKEAVKDLKELDRSQQLQILTLLSANS
jgi:mRNA-degrading endonuclease RelE of RelBE toxin-antitoxin system